MHRKQMLDKGLLALLNSLDGVSGIISGGFIHINFPHRESKKEDFCISNLQKPPSPSLTKQEITIRISVDPGN
jgi:hypothetical protein